MGWACSTNRGEEECIWNIVVKVRRKEIISLGRPRRKWVDNIKMDLRETD
jgi:hypothetical protein